MKAHVINLKHRRDRLTQIKNQCEKESLDFVRHEAVNGQKQFFDVIPSKRMRGHAGCQQSHMNLLSSVKGSSDWHLILEDDAVLIEGFKDKAKHIIDTLPKDAQMCYLGGNTYLYDDSIEDYNEELVRAFKVMATHCYIIKDSAIDSMLEVLNRRYHKVDVCMMDFQLENVVYMTKECLSWQRESMSDIVFKTTISSPKY
jgi:GR25 family glycosyltransferase involved in LPS biosynthesis